MLGTPSLELVTLGDGGVGPMHQVALAQLCGLCQDLGTEPAGAWLLSLRAALATCIMSGISRVKQHESRPLGTPTRGLGWTDGGDSMVEATHSSLSLAWLEAGPSGAKPGLGFCMRADETGSWFD